MYSESDLEAAVTAGALSPEHATRFRNFISASRHTSVVDEEHFRLLTGFNDIFVAIAAVILLVAMAWIGHSIPPNVGGDGPSLFMGLFVAGTAWGLAEFFTRKRRMALPSIILLLAFIGGVFAASAAAIVLVVGESTLQQNEETVALVMSGAAAIAAGAAWLHWRRFMVPITVAAGAAALVALVLGLIAYAISGMAAAEDIFMVLSLAAGIAVFLFAMRWDASDPLRQTRRSDVAFWLHLLAAPMIVHPIFTLLGLMDGTATTMEAIVVILLYVILGVAALAIDRRALLVSALAYVLFALNSLFQTYGAVELSFALTALVIGSALLLLSAFWHTARVGVVHRLPGTLQSRLPATGQAVATA